MDITYKGVNYLNISNKEDNEKFSNYENNKFEEHKYMELWLSILNEPKCNKELQTNIKEMKPIFNKVFYGCKYNKKIENEFSKYENNIPENLYISNNSIFE